MNMFDRLIWVLDEIPHAAALNMAIDEALLQTEENAVLFRSYQWQRPSVSIGYFTAWSRANALYSGREIVRRWTGGGIVEHGEDFTYSLLLPSSHRLLPTRELYRQVHAAITKSLHEFGYLAAVITEKAPDHSDLCFDSPVESDVEVDGMKVAGAAVRRLRTGIIFQGSIQRVSVKDRFADRFVHNLAGFVEKRMLSPVTTLLAERIANEKYGNESWTRRY
jgi:lipoyl(octanoyl) transferase